MALQDWANRLQANPRFRRFAAAFPLTRFVARRRARALFDLCAGFVYTQVLTACVRLDLFPGHPIALQQRITLRARYGMRMIVRKRDQ